MLNQTYARARVRRCPLVILAAAMLSSLCACGGGEAPSGPSAEPTPAPVRLEVIVGSTILRGFDIGVDTSHQQRSWLVKELGQFRMSYPPRQDWGVVFVTNGSVTGSTRQSVDLAAYDDLVVDLKGLRGDEAVGIGIKSLDQGDGSEHVIAQHVTAEWQTYRYPLRSFVGTDLRRVWILIEFVFLREQPADVFFRNVRLDGVRR